MDLELELIKTTQAAERDAAARRACALVAEILAARSPGALTPETVAALQAGELSTAGAGYSSPLRNGRGGRT